ncbi:DUF402 domain-containing protein [Alicyclobacillus sp.]|uniref:DUF402 domain-containing protein n=1 Tax=Alicyclobacillus sp. TaxID=61169 RepID=UPI0025B89FFB|nr:DUF402 domain-containing protein [Alicyclobacillus sp.]MCL6517118.1 DUF402 domain-containing protein [Alicyclobacillus sp.]
MKLVSLHGDGRPHRVWDSVEETFDPWVFHIPPGAPVLEADGRVWSSDYPVWAVFWPDRYYQVFQLCKPEGIAYYCNVITPPVYDAEERIVRFRDLDLDVYVDGAGIRLLDEEQFAARRSGYPPEWVREALAASHELVRLARLRRGPFTPGGILIPPASARRPPGACAPAP